MQDPDPRPTFEKLLRPKSRLGAFDRDRDKTARSKFKKENFFVSLQLLITFFI